MVTGPTTTDAAHPGSAQNGLGQTAAARAAGSRTPGGLNGQRAAAAVAFLAGVLCGVGGFTVMVAWFVHSGAVLHWPCLLYTSPSPRDGLLSRMPSSA